ncbi:MAG: ECF transporter S component [Tyzzerella sp.]|nr:ECF transporter S component [Tyzzerella sp.]
MNRKISTKQITTTALLLALCIVFQSMKGLSIYLTGSAVNCILVIATLYCGLFSGTCIAILTPVVAYFMGATPIMNMIPLMMLVIMVGNELIVLCVWLFHKKRMEVGMLLGCVTKALFLWLAVWFAVLPIFGTKLPEPMVMTVKTTFSITQFVTACIGSVIAWVIYKKGLKKYEDTSNC